jgi:glycosyltransferase involved in cell wall biosynthesis
MKKISIVTPTFNEEANVEELYNRITETMSNLPYDYEIIFIDNASTDDTSINIRAICVNDKKVKLIQNARNFGHIRSPYYGLLQANGDAVVAIASDLQDPPELIESFIRSWEAGNKVVLAVKESTDEGLIWKTIRKRYYKLVSKLSNSPQIQNATGAGLFDKSVVAELRKLQEPYPYFRGLIAELGFPVNTVEFHQPKRKSGQTKNNLVTLFDIAILGITTHTHAPMRLISFFGLVTAGISFLIAVGYTIAKILFWNSFQIGLAPVIIGVFFFGSVQIFLIGLIGEYLANIQRRIRNLPLVIEQERINF